MDRPWKAPLAQKLIRPSSCTFRISTPGTWLRHVVQRLHATSCAGVFFTVERATIRKATTSDVSEEPRARGDGGDWCMGPSLQPGPESSRGGRTRVPRTCRLGGPEESLESRKPARITTEMTLNSLDPLVEITVTACIPDRQQETSHGHSTRAAGRGGDDRHGPARGAERRGRSRGERAG